MRPKRRARWVVCGLILLALVAAWRLAAGSAPPTAAPSGRPLPFSHVFVIVMENQNAAALLRNPAAPYIRRLAQRYGYDRDYFGVTHPSLPNYVALIAGRTFGSHSDSPAQRFSGPTLAGQLDRHHIGWLAAMQSLPEPGYGGAWYPAGPNDSEIPASLYAEKHDPFMLFDALRAVARRHVVPLSVLGADLRRGRVPPFVFIVPNLCDDMHGQLPGPGAVCPATDPTRLVRDGNGFLARWVPAILHSSAWRGNAVLFVVWDESGWQGVSPGSLLHYFQGGPASPPWLRALPFLGTYGGGPVPLIVIARLRPHRVDTALWADHYSLLKTIEASWGLGTIGHAASPGVPLLTPFVPSHP
jgi:hypothetical protein